MFNQSHRVVRWIGAGLAAFAAASTVWIIGAGDPASARTVIGRADLKLATGASIGAISFENPKDGDATVVKADLKIPIGAFATQTFHGFHIHANDDVTNGLGCVADATRASNTWFVSADGHWKRDTNDGHGSHAGDLTSLYFNRDGSVHLEFTTDRFIGGEIFDRVVILHSGSDNFGNIPLGSAAAQYTANASDATTATRNTGNAGDRIACGVIDVK